MIYSYIVHSYVVFTNILPNGIFMFNMHVFDGKTTTTLDGRLKIARLNVICLVYMRRPVWAWHEVPPRPYCNCGIMRTHGYTVRFRRPISRGIRSISQYINHITTIALFLFLLGYTPNHLLQHRINQHYICRFNK